MASGPGFEPAVRRVGFLRRPLYGGYPPVGVRVQIGDYIGDRKHPIPEKPEN